MIRWVGAAILVCLPLPTIGQAAQSDCASIPPFVQGLDGISRIELLENASNATPTGWCEVRKAVFFGYELQFEAAAFRFEDAPTDTTFELAVTNLQTDIGTLDVEVLLGHDRQSGDLALESFTARGADGRGMEATARLQSENAAVTNEIQSSISDLRLGNASAKVFVTPPLMAALDIDFRDVTRTSVDSALRDVSTMQVSRKSRRAFLGFVGATPNAWGTVEIDIATNSRVGLLQLVGPILNLGRTPDDDEISHALEVALTNVTLDFTWKPGRM